MRSLTPMMQQYLDIKKQYADCILFFRLGDFYEMFFEDAETASNILDIVLTGRDCGQEKRAPMCGIPFHSADAYIARLISGGHKVAICEQVEDPALAKGLVRREVIRVVTPGTVTDAAMLEDKRNNYLMSIYKYGLYYGIASVDLSTGEFSTTQIVWGNTSSRLLDEAAKYHPSEIVVNSEFVRDTALCAETSVRIGVKADVLDDSYYQYDNVIGLIRQFFPDDDIQPEDDSRLALIASGALLGYLVRTQKTDLSHIGRIGRYSTEGYMLLDSSTRRNLELTETIRTRSRKGSLLWVIDKTVTPMGGRMLRKWLDQPLSDIDVIMERHEAVAEYLEKFIIRSEIRELLKGVCDIERMTSRIAMGNVGCRELIALKNTLGQMPRLRTLLLRLEAQMNLKCIAELDMLEDIYRLIDSAIVDNPPLSITEGGILKEGYNHEVDRYRKASTDGKDWIAALENSEREKTRIRNLKVSFNRVFGYYIEITKSNLHMVPQNYIRKQTLANCERYVTQELKEFENEILGAEEKLTELEYRLFTQVRSAIAGTVGRIRITASVLARVDVISGLAETADRESYCRPVFNTEGLINIKYGRHPVVERMLDKGLFVANDTQLDMESNRLSIITGPNMAGKSTYIRQVALIVLMAQIGSFVPAQSADLCAADRIFTRVGASDDLSAGQSTFMVEMSEVAHILKNATSRSLLLFDEVGRGTSTYDGLSIAWAIVEYVCDKDKIGSKTLFATHYHELTELEGKIPGIKNYCIAVEESGEDIVFLRKIKRGGADGSYGIQVARIAGVPSQVTDRAREILRQLEEADISKKDTRPNKNKMPLDGQNDLFSLSGISKNNEELVAELKQLDIPSITPLDAINTLYRLQQKARGRE